MKTRLISVACMLPVVVFLFLGKAWLWAACLIIAGACLYEFFNALGKIHVMVSMPIALALFISYYAIVLGCIIIAKSWELYEALFDAWLFALVLISLILILFDLNHQILGPTYCIVGMLYIGWSIAHLVLIEQKYHALAWLPVVIACFADIGGYLGGMAFGKHKMAPVLSPKKTIEGSIVGIIFGTASSIAFCALFFKGHFASSLIMGILGSVIAECGDLIASTFKRKTGIKDYSNLIPGHGGVFDRMDSICMVAPFVYYYFTLFIE